jgi:hypothetical protein
LRFAFTEADLALALAEGLIDPDEVEAKVEIVTEYVYPPEIAKALGIRAGRREPKPRSGQ